MLSLHTGAERIALIVHGVSTLDAATPDYATTRRVSVSEFERRLPARSLPPPFFGRLRSSAPPPLPKVYPQRRLCLVSGERAWLADQAIVAAVLPPTPVARTPLAAAPLIGAASLLGEVMPVIALTPPSGPPVVFVVVRDSLGPLAVALETMPAWTEATEGDALDLPALRASARLQPAPASPVTARPPLESRTFLPVTIADSRFFMPLEDVEQVLQHRPVARLPRGYRGGVVSAVIAAKGGVVPLIDGRRWLGLPSSDEPGLCVLIRHGRPALRVDAAHGLVAVESAAVRPLQDPSSRLSGSVRLNGQTIAVLNLRALATTA